MESNDVIISWSSSLYALLDVWTMDGGSPCNNLLEHQSADSQHRRGLRLELPALPVHDLAPPVSSSSMPSLSSLLFCWLCNAPRHALFPGILLSVLALTTKTYCWSAPFCKSSTKKRHYAPDLCILSISLSGTLGALGIGVAGTAGLSPGVGLGILLPGIDWLLGINDKAGGFLLCVVIRLGCG